MRQCISRRFFLPSVLLLFAVICGPTIVSARARTRHPHERAKAPAVEPVPLSQIRVYGGVQAPFSLDARAAMLLDGHSGAVLYAFNEHEKMQPASLAKMMTFYLTLKALAQKRITLDTQVTISKQAWELSMNRSVSRMFLRVGQQVPVHDLLYGLVVSSGNDAAVALAEYLAGSAEAFVSQMNAEAARLGLTETHFMNPDGLPADGQYTTAADMAKLGRDLVERFPNALTYTSAKYFTFDKIRQPNFNALLFHDSRVNGIKTGHVNAAGYHLVASADSNGMELISCVLGAPSESQRWIQSEKLIAWAFRTFSSVHPDLRKSVPASLPVYGGTADVVAIAPASIPYLTVERGKEKDVAVAYAARTKYLVAPVARGTQVGDVTITLAGKTVASAPVVTQAPVARGGFFKRVTDRIRLML